MSESSTRSSGGRAPGSSRSSGGQYGSPRAAKTRASSGSAGSGPSAARTRVNPWRGRARCRTSPATRRRASPDAVQRQPDGPPLVALEHRHDRRKRGESRDRLRPAAPTARRPTSSVESSQKRRGGTRHAHRRAPTRSRVPSARLLSTVSPRADIASPAERRCDRRLGLLADAGHLSQAAGGDSRLELGHRLRHRVRGRCSTCASRSHRAGARSSRARVGSSSCSAASSRDLARLDQLAELGLDAGADAAQLAYTARRGRAPQRAVESSA